MIHILLFNDELPKQMRLSLFLRHSGVVWGPFQSSIFNLCVWQIFLILSHSFIM